MVISFSYSQINEQGINQLPLNEPLCEQPGLQEHPV